MNPSHNPSSRPHPNFPNNPASEDLWTTATPPPVLFAQFNLRYQGQGAKFVTRFDANFYIRVTCHVDMDTHDVVSSLKRFNFLSSYDMDEIIPRTNSMKGGSYEGRERRYKESN